MKLLIPALIFIFIVSHLSMAQTGKGRLIAGGSFTYDYFKPEEGKKFSILQITPMAAFLPVNNLAIGFAVKIESNTYDETTLTSSAVGPWIRYYAPFKYKAFVQGAYYLNSQQLSDSLTVTSNSFIGTLGYAIFFNNHIALEPQIFFRRDNSRDISPAKGYGFALGLTAYFGGNKK